MAARERTVFLGLGHEEGPGWALVLELARGLARALQRGRVVEQACWEFAQGVRDALVGVDEPAARGYPQ